MARKSSPRLTSKAYWGIRNRLRSIKTSINSLFFNWTFSTKGCCVHSDCEVYGLHAIEIGKNFKARAGLWLHAVISYEDQLFNPKIFIGNNVAASKNLHIAAINSVSIHDNVLIGSNVLITDHNHGIYDAAIKSVLPSEPSEAPSSRKLSGHSVVIESNVFLGDGCIILPGSHIGTGSVLGAGTVVSGYIANASIAAGAPAKIIKNFDPNSASWKRKKPN